MPLICRLVNGATTINLAGGTTTNGGTSTIQTRPFTIPRTVPFIVRSESPLGSHQRQVRRTYPSNKTIAVPIEIEGQDADRVGRVLRDIEALLERPGTVFEFSPDGTTITVYDLLRSVGPDLPANFGLVNLDGAYVDTLTLVLDCKPFGRPASTSTVTATSVPFAGGTYQGAALFSVPAASGDVPPLTTWKLTKSATGDDVSKVWVVAAEPTVDTYIATVTADTPVGWWRLGETSGTTAEDATVNNRDGTYDNTPTLGATGALAFDSDKAVTFTAASSQKVTVADNAAFRFTSALSLECWVKRTTNVQSGLISKGTPSATNGAYDLQIAVTDQVHFDLRIGGASQVLVVDDVVGALGNWYHIVATYDGATQKVYVDGTLRGTRAQTGAVATSTLALLLGARNNNGTAVNFLNGTLDEPAVYNYALTPGEVQAHYLAGVGVHMALYNPGQTTGATPVWTSGGVGTSVATDATAVSPAASNNIVRWTPTGTTDEPIGWFTIPARPPGTYMVLGLLKQTGGAIGDIYAWVSSAPTQNPTVLGGQVQRARAPVVGAWAVWDLGIVQLPPGAEADSRLYIYGNRSTGSATLDVDAIFLGHIPTYGGLVDDLSGGSCWASYHGLSTATFTGPIELDGRADPPTFSIQSAAGQPQVLRPGGPAPKLSAGRLAKPLHLLVVSAKSDGSFAKAVGVSTATPPTATYWPQFLTVATG